MLSDSSAMYGVKGYHEPTGIRAAIEQDAPQPQQQDARDGYNGPEIVACLQIGLQITTVSVETATAQD